MRVKSWKEHQEEMWAADKKEWRQIAIGLAVVAALILITWAST